MLRRLLGIFLFGAILIPFAFLNAYAAPSDPFFARWLDDKTIEMGGEGVVEAFLLEGGTTGNETQFTDNLVDYVDDDGRCYIRLALTIFNSIPTQGKVEVTTTGLVLGGEIPECGGRAKPLEDKWDGQLIDIGNIDKSGRQVTQGRVQITINLPLLNPENSDVQSPPVPAETAYLIQNRETNAEVGRFNAPFSGGSEDKQQAIYRHRVVLDIGVYRACLIDTDVCQNFEIKGGETTETTLNSNAPPIRTSGEELTCENRAGPFGWIVCEAIETTYNAAVGLYKGFAKQVLETQPINRDTGDGALYAVWSAFRTIANVGFVIAFMVIIFAQATSLNIEAYTIRKILPRIVLGAILVQLSFTLCAFLVDITNVLGNGVYTLITNAAESAGGNEFAVDFGDAAVLNAIGGASGIAAAAGAIGVAAGLISIGPILIICLFAVLAAVFTLIIRNVLILMLIVLSPVAAVAWLLPNTEQYFKSWFSLFMKLLMMYPIIQIIVAMGALAAAVIGG